MEIDGKTRLIGLMGNPVEHTLSPVIHNGISKRMGISSVYMPFHVEEEGVGDAVRGAYALNVLGMNVTVPHKNAVKDYLVEMDEAAEHIGAVNTLVRIEEKHGYKGYNTDMMGLRRQIHEDGIDLAGQTVVILGAGGAAKAVVYMCILDRAEKVYLLNRTVAKAETIAEQMNVLQQSGKITDVGYKTGQSQKETMSRMDGPAMTQVIPMAMQDYAKISEDDLIVFQATSIGLSPHVDDVVLEDKVFYSKVRIGVDLIYNPATTKFMKLVMEQGGKAYNALKMLLYQGVIAYELWHNITVPQDIVEDIYVDLKRKVYPKDNYVLIGFMGSGKTTFGKALAAHCGMDFLDTDDYIEQQAGKTIAQIFAEDGEEAFRQIETDTLIQLRDSLHNTVVATGGGMPLRKENARLLKEIGTVNYLTATCKEIYDRVKDDTKRPLLQTDNPYEKICNMMKERKPKYEAACDKVIDTNSNDIEEIIGAIVG
ncbi:MAG TPA: shikimate dehydrogenase [Lachnospiraceae bacterium]|nr:shikimate dehydrogenase [Lachnospiraceae bacterium]